MKCPTCKKTVETKEENPYSPFCSERCKWIDLGNWLDEKYVVFNPHLSEGQNEDDNA